MADFSSFKIPLYDGKNSNPSQEGDEKHPNGSFVTNRYNALIDELVSIISEIQSPTSPPFTGYIEDLYVNSATGDNSNDGSQANPFSTIERAIEELEGKILINPAINIEGTFIDPVLDFSRIVNLSTNLNGDTNGSDRLFNYGVLLVGINNPTIRFTDSFDANTYESTNKPLFHFNSGKNYLELFFVTIEHTGNERIEFSHQNIRFKNCIFTTAQKLDWSGSAFIQAIKSNLIVDSCTFNMNDNHHFMCFNLLDGCRFEIKNSTLNDAGSGSFIWFDADYSTLILSSGNTLNLDNGSEFCQIFANSTENANESDLTTKWGVDPTKNFIKLGVI